MARFSILFTLTVVVFTTPTKFYLLTCGALKKKKSARHSLERQIEQWDASYKTSCGWKLSLDVSITLTVGINLWAICSDENYGVLSLAWLFVTTQGKFCCTNTKKNTENIIRTLPNTAWKCHLCLAAVWGEKETNWLAKSRNWDKENENVLPLLLQIHRGAVHTQSQTLYCRSLSLSIPYSKQHNQPSVFFKSGLALPQSISFKEESI